MNESANAFINNYEAIDVFTSWSEEKAEFLAKYQCLITCGMTASRV